MHALAPWLFGSAWMIGFHRAGAVIRRHLRDQRDGCRFDLPRPPHQRR